MVRSLRYELHDSVQNIFDAFSLRGGALQDRYDVPFFEPVHQSAVVFFRCELFAFEVFFHQFFIGFGDSFHQRIFIIQCYHGCAEFIFQSVDDCINVYVFFVSLGQNEHLRHIELLAGVPCLFGPDLDTGRSVYQDRCGVYSSHSGIYFTYEVKESRSVHEVDLHLIVFNRNDGCGNGITFFDLHLVVVGYGVAVFYFTHSAEDSGFQQRCFQESGLSAAAVPQERNVSDTVSVIAFHN